MTNIKYVNDNEKKVNIHRNTRTCPEIYEVVPVRGCDFSCIYCNALGQEEETKFLPVEIDVDYPNFLENEIMKHQQMDIYPIYYYSPKTDCFQKPLLETGITTEILKVFEKTKSRFIIVTKGVPDEATFEVLKRTKEFCQVIITRGMPNEKLREIVEPNASTNEERMKFAEQCIKNGISTAGIIEPIIPFNDLSFVETIMQEFAEIGVKHFAIDFARISDISLRRLVNELPEYRDELISNYKFENCHKETFKTACGNIVERYSPSKEFMYKKFCEFKQFAKSIECTTSVCNSFGFDGFNREANQKGYICMGIDMKKFDVKSEGLERSK